MIASSKCFSLPLRAEVERAFAGYDEAEQIGTVVELLRDELALLDLECREESGDLNRSRIASLRKVEEVARENGSTARRLKEAT